MSQIDYKTTEPCLWCGGVLYKLSETDARCGSCNMLYTIPGPAKYNTATDAEVNRVWREMAHTAINRVREPLDWAFLRTSPFKYASQDYLAELGLIHRDSDRRACKGKKP